MRKAIVTVIYDAKTNYLFNITVNPLRGGKITLLNAKMTNNKLEPAYKDATFKSAYHSALNIIKNNGFYCNSWRDFGATFYEINWIDINNPTEVHYYSIPI